MKIEAHELRIGNIVQCNWGGMCEVLGIGERGIEVVFPEETIYMGYNEFSSVTLTEKHLIRLGFQNKGSIYTIDNDRFEFSMIFHDAWNVYYKEKKGFGSDEINLTGFWNIHQLQNLYLSLTSEELLYK